MIVSNSKIHIIDNSGIKLVKVISKKKTLGEFAKISVLKYKKTKFLKDIKKIYTIFIVSINKNIQLKNSFYLRSFKNSGIIISPINNQKLLGSRIKNPVLNLLRKTKLIKFITLVPFFLC